MVSEKGGTQREQDGRETCAETGHRICRAEAKTGTGGGAVSKLTVEAARWGLLRHHMIALRPQRQLQTVLGCVVPGPRALVRYMPQLLR